MTREELTRKICPSFMYSNCENQEDCNYCKGKMNIWLDEYDKQIKAEVIDKFLNKVCSLRIYDNDLSLADLKIVADELKEQNK